MYPDFRRCKGMSKEQKQAMYESMQKNPMGMLRVWGRINMGANMLWTFVVFLVVSVAIAYLGWAALPHARDSFGHVFQVLGTAGVLAYCFASFPSVLTSVQQHLSTSFFASVQCILPPSRGSQQHLSTSRPVREQRYLPVFSAAAFPSFLAQQAGVFGSSDVNPDAASIPVQQSAKAVLRCIFPPTTLQRVSLKITSMSSS
jgi:hypothetical protein